MRSIYQVFSFDIMSRILIGVIGIILIRYMPEKEYALYTFTLSLITLVAQTLSATFRRIYIVGYDSFRLNQYKDSFLGLQLLLVLLFTVISVPFSQHFNGVYIWTITMIFGFTLVEFTKTTYQKEQKFMSFSIIEITRSALFFILTLVLIYSLGHKINAWQILMIQSIPMVFIFLAVFWKSVKIKEIINVKKSLQIGRKIFSGQYKFLLGFTLFVTILGQLDVLMLKYFSNESELATYGSAFRYYSLLLLALNSVNSVFLPVIQNINKRSELDDLYNKHTKILAVFIPLVLLGAWLAKWIIPIIDMGKYPDAVPVFQILAISAILSFIFSPHTSLVMKFEDFKFLYYVIVIAVLMNIILNIFMIPLFGSVGAAIATLITFGFSNFMTYVRAQQCRTYLSSSQ